MSRTKQIALGVFIAAVAGIGYGEYTAWRYQQAFDKTRDGEHISIVLHRFGEPSVRERTGEAPFTRYAGKTCHDPCQERLWFERPLLSGIEAWSVEVGIDGHVLHTAHWVSP